MRKSEGQRIPEKEIVKQYFCGEEQNGHNATRYSFFFDRHQAVYPLYECFQEKLLARFPESRIKVQKSQISYCNRHHYACVSFLKVKKKSELPEDYFVLTLGLSAPLESDRVAAKTEPYPGRWTTHFVISSPSDSDEKLFDWIELAYSFAQEK